MIQLNEPFQLFTPDQCEDLIRRARAEQMIQGQTYTSRKNIRTNHIVWLNLDQHEYDYLWELVKDFWGQVHWYEQPIQISRYSPGEFYDWHSDSKPNHRRTSVRHLTLTCTLQTAPAAIFETKLKSYDLRPGEAVIFPSDLDHRACAPTQGERWSFTIWYMKRNAEKT